MDTQPFRPKGGQIDIGAACEDQHEDGAEKKGVQKDWIQKGDGAGMEIHEGNGPGQRDGVTRSVNAERLKSWCA